MSKEIEVDKLIDRVLWMPLPTLERLSAEVVRNQRTEQRYTTQAGARFIAAGSDDEKEIKVTNVSKSGVGIEAPFAVEVGSVATVIVGTTVMMGQVRWCRMNNATFEAGIHAQRVGFMQ